MAASRGQAEPQPRPEVGDILIVIRKFVFAAAALNGMRDIVGLVAVCGAAKLLPTSVPAMDERASL